MSIVDPNVNSSRLLRLRLLSASLAVSNPTNFSELQREYALETPRQMPAHLLFLGTGQGTHNIAARGPLKNRGRFVSGPQISSGSTTVWIDPGPDALELLNLSGIDPRHIDALLISHAHTDHYGNIASTIEAITGGTEIKGTKSLYGNRTALMGSAVSPPLLSDYHSRDILREARALSPGDVVDVGDIAVTALPCSHRENPVADDSLNWALDLRLSTRTLRIVCFDGNVFRVADRNSTNEVLEDVALCAVKCDVLIVNVSNHIRVSSSPQNYVSTKGLIYLASRTNAPIVFTQHFGIEMLRTSDDEAAALALEGFTDEPSFQAALAEEEARAAGNDVRVVAAADLMRVELRPDDIRLDNGDSIKWK